jgi:hypothetical protein
MKKKSVMAIGGIVTVLLLSSTSIALAKDLSDFRYRDSNSDIGVGHDNYKRPQPQIPLMSFANAHSPSSSPHPHTYQAYYRGPYGYWTTSAVNDKGKFQESLQLNYTNDTCRMNFSNEGNTPVNITYNVSVSSNHHLSGCHGKLALGAGESREISENIAVKKDWRNFSFKSEMKIGSDSNSDSNSKINGTQTSMSFKVISWYSFSSKPVPNDSEEVDGDIND